MLIDKSSHPWDLLEIKFSIIAMISCDDVIFTYVQRRNASLSQSVDKLLEFCNGVHRDAKDLLKIAAF